jgi:hypothetical protein
MKIADIFSDSHYIAIVKMMCKSAGIHIPEHTEQRINGLITRNERFFVFIDKTSVEIAEMRERSELLAKIVAGRVKRGFVLFFHNGKMREVTFQNIKETFRWIAPKTIERDDRVLIARKKRTMFDECKLDVRKKYRNKGFIRTEIANESMERFCTYTIIKP